MNNPEQPKADESQEVVEPFSEVVADVLWIFCKMLLALSVMLLLAVNLNLPQEFVYSAVFVTGILAKLTVPVVGVLFWIWILDSWGNRRSKEE